MNDFKSEDTPCVKILRNVHAKVSGTFITLLFKIIQQGNNNDCPSSSPPHPLAGWLTCEQSKWLPNCSPLTRFEDARAMLAIAVSGKASLFLYLFSAIMKKTILYKMIFISKLFHIDMLINEICKLKFLNC